ncbi:MAG: glycosyltransferase [Saprospiraceae bacterium]|nr:glycosyltransferase [Saprospiraceae bacterium]
MYQYDIGIVIVNYNVRHFLIQCLQSVRNSKIHELKIQVWVVDNASIDGSVNYIEKFYPEVKIIVNQNNKGFSAANNQALKQLNSKYALLLNPDTILEEDTLHKCYSFMEAHPKSGALGVRMIDGTGKFLPESKRQVPDLWNSFCKLTYLSDMFPTSRKFSGYNLGYLAENEINEIEVLCGAFMFIRSHVFEEIGWLDEAFFMYGEDIDFSYRIKKAGYKIFYFPETSIIHYKGESTRKSSLNYVKTFYGAMHVYVNKHFTKGNADLFSAFIKSAIFLRAIVSVVSRLIKDWFLPFLDIFLIWFLITKIKYIWAAYYFNNKGYYDSTNIDIIVGIYSLIWVLFLWLSGQYDKKKSLTNTLTGVFSGTLFILICYALLPENMRTSRVIILIGALITFFNCLFTSIFSTFIGSYFGKNKEVQQVNIVIVAFKDVAEKLIQTLNHSKISYENIYVVSPLPVGNDFYYTNTLQYLPKIVKDLKINEVIYSNESMSMKEIIHSMTSMNAKVSFKIGGDDSLSIIGSNSKHGQGEFYSLDISYRLSESRSMKFKRFFDIISSLLLLLFSPFIFVSNNFRLRFLKNILLVFTGKLTMVGYGGDITDYSFLPELPRAIIKYPLSSKIIHYTEDYFKKMNISYAKEYNFTTDMVVLMNNLYKLSNAT